MSASEIEAAGWLLVMVAAYLTHRRLVLTLEQKLERYQRYPDEGDELVSWPRLARALKRGAFWCVRWSIFWALALACLWEVTR